MSINSERSSKYFIDGIRYNCPFCKTGCVKYTVEEKGDFSWDNNKLVYFYVIECELCEKNSFHLSYYDIEITSRHFCVNPKKRVRKKTSTGLNMITPQDLIPIKDLKSGEIITEYDHLFFYHRPPSGFTIDARIPGEIGELIGEAEGCANVGYLTGASACIRKAIYKLLKENEIPEYDNTDKLSYDKRLDLLKFKCANVQPDLINTLKDIKFISDQELHENDWPDISTKNINLLKAVLKEILMEIYILPAEKQKRRQQIQMLKEETKKGK